MKSIRNYYIKNFLQRSFLYLYKIGIRLGIHILPAHYYSPALDIIELKKTKDIWAKKSELPGVSFDLIEQVSNLKKICLPYREEYIGNRIYKDAASKAFGLGYGYVEAQALHCIIRHYKPKKIIEVGSGVSSYCISAALQKNNEETGVEASLTCIEPYHSKRLNGLRGAKIVPKKVQSVPLRFFSELKAGDLLFIDSSHTVKPGSDVNHLILEVLPRLNKGVIVHFHDIFLPYDYQRSVLLDFFYWTETSLLHAYLIHNNKIRIIFCLSQLHCDQKNILNEIFPEYDPEPDKEGLVNRKYRLFERPTQHFPSSIYFQTQ